MKSRGLLAVACAAMLMAGCNRGNRASNTIANGNDAGITGTAGYSVSTSDKKFVNDILSDGMAEVETAKLAREHAANLDVKQFAQMMIDDHTKAGDQLKQIANTYAVPQDVKIDVKHQKLMDKLSKLNGTEFDKEYMSAMVDDHEDAVRDLRSRVDENRSVTDRLTGKNPENPEAVKPEPADDRVKASINEWAAATLPTIERHLDRAKQIKDKIDHNNGDTRGTTGANDTKAKASKY